MLASQIALQSSLQSLRNSSNMSNTSHQSYTSGNRYRMYSSGTTPKWQKDFSQFLALCRENDFSEIEALWGDIGSKEQKQLLNKPLEKINENDLPMSFAMSGLVMQARDPSLRDFLIRIHDLALQAERDSEYSFSPSSSSASY